MTLIQDESLSGSAVLGIGAFGHDAAACLVDKATGAVLYAVAEERIRNLKHDAHLPLGAVARCEAHAASRGLRITDAAVNFDESTFVSGNLQAEIRALVSDPSAASAFYARVAGFVPLGDYYYFEGASLSNAAIDPALRALGLPLAAERTLRSRLCWYYNWAIKYKHLFQVLQGRFPGVTLHRVPHHVALAASAFFNSGFPRATVLTIDGQGESETVTVSRGDEAGLHAVSGTLAPASLGIFYLFATMHLGFDLGDEYKVMGMAAYGEPRFYDVLARTMHVNDDAQLVFTETEHFRRQPVGQNNGHVAFDFTEALDRIAAPRRPDEAVRQEHFDFAASVQKLTERIGVDLARAAMRRTGESRLAIAGGVGLNGLMNQRIREESGCTELFVYPASGDDGTAVGAAQQVAFAARPFPRRPAITTAYYGYEPTDAEIRAELDRRGLVYTRPDDLHATMAQALVAKNVVARYVGRAEFGPRALGNRSILASPLDAGMKDVLNLRIKHREEFRPFAPACKRERAREYFDFDGDAPFMLLIGRATPKAAREVPAVVHRDGTARLQTVTAEQSADFYGILDAFERLTSVPVLINTSFNVNGEAIVDSPADAIESFGHMDVDCLAIGDYWLSRRENQDKFPTLDRESYLGLRRARFAALELGPIADIDIILFNAAFYHRDSAEQVVQGIRAAVRGWLANKPFGPALRETLRRVGVR